jgi:hypothetical protein
MMNDELFGIHHSSFITHHSKQVPIPAARNSAPEDERKHGKASRS